MAESKATVIVPLKGENYATWKVQCRMALVHDGLWGIVSGTETVPDPGQERQKFLARRDRALATIVLAVDPSLLYLLGDPEDPVAVWKKLQNQFQKKVTCLVLEDLMGQVSSSTPATHPCVERRRVHARSCQDYDRIVQ